jgi:hypothetical protein
MSILPQAIGTALAVGNSLINGGGATQAPGQGAGQFPVLLGAVTLQGFEVPDTAPWGGDQALTVHKLIGGARVIDAMGIDDRAITIKGTFLSPDADQRALQVDVMRKAGQPVQFAWHSHVYLVVIKSFQPEFQRPDRVPYTLTVEILQDQTQPIGIPEPSDDDLFGSALGAIGTALVSLAGGGPPSIAAVASTGAALASVTAAIGLAQGFAPAAALGVPVATSGFQGAVGAMIGSVAGGIGGPVLSGLTGALAIGGGVSSASAGNLATMAAAVTAGRAILAPALGFGDAYLSGIPALGGVVAAIAPPANTAALTAATAMAAALPSLQQIDANLGVMQQIIGRASP